MDSFTYTYSKREELLSSFTDLNTRYNVKNDHFEQLQRDFEKLDNKLEYLITKGIQYKNVPLISKIRPFSERERNSICKTRPFQVRETHADVDHSHSEGGSTPSSDSDGERFQITGSSRKVLETCILPAAIKKPHSWAAII